MWRGKRRRSALTLLELVIASSMLAVVVTSLSLVLRTARSSWEINDSSFGALQHAHAVARHFVRQAREAASVTALTGGGTSIGLQLRDGSQLTWSHASSGGGFTDVVLVTFSATGDQIPLAYDIRNLSFIGYEADGTTVTTAADDIRLVQVNVTVATPGGATQTVSSMVWIRAW